MNGLYINIREFLRGTYMTATSTTPIAPTAINSDIASVNNGDAVTTRTIDEAQYHTAPAQLFPNTLQEEIHNTRQFAMNANGDEFYLNNNNQAFAIPGYSETFQAKMQHSVQKMIRSAQSNNQFKPLISLQTIDRRDFGLNSTKEYFTVEAPPIQAYKTSKLVKEAGYQVFAMPNRNGHEMVIVDQSGKTITGSELNTFFETFSDPVAQEYSQAIA